MKSMLTVGGINNIQRGLHTSGPLELPVNAVAANGTRNSIPEHGANVRCSLGENAGAVVEVGGLVGREWAAPRLVEVVEDNAGLFHNHISLANSQPSSPGNFQRLL